MNLRTEWTNNGYELNRFYTAEETVNEVKENFDIRRLYSAEGKYVTVNDVTEKCLVQTSSNPLKQLNDELKICCPKTMSVNRGDFVQYENSNWMIDTNVVDIDGAYWFTRIIRCTYLLKWQNKSGEVKERWCVTQNAVQYNNGESGNSTITLGSDQLMILIPYDEDTIKLRRGKRFFISNDLEEPIVYELTRPDSTTYVKDGHGYLCIMVTEDQTNSENDRKDLMLCDYIDVSAKPDNPNQSTILLTINSPKDFVKVGGAYITFKGIITDEDGNTTNSVGIFSIDSSFADKITTNTTVENQIKIKVADNYRDLIGCSFDLVFTFNDYSVSKTITIENYS